ncbi:hypothetical protein M5K25_013227 [Dendrobium thyrsiflorum]|uniref:Uncharacterized protein n=1 Tax=Dendrobium thyrsiflorum TaxID=117978 RepID=A0ABD0UTB1_DENTH
MVVSGIIRGKKSYRSVDEGSKSSIDELLLTKSWSAAVVAPGVPCGPVQHPSSPSSLANATLPPPAEAVPPARSRDKPKSPTLIRISRSTKMLLDVMSRWTTGGLRAKCRYSMAAAVWSAMSTRTGQVRATLRYKLRVPWRWSARVPFGT